MSAVVLVVASVVLVGTVPAAASSTTGTYRGRTLDDVLREFREAGLPLIWSSAIVRPDTIVDVEPDEDDPRVALDAILRSAGLRAETGPGRTLLVVPAPAGEAAGDDERPPATRPRGLSLGFRTDVRVVPGQRSVDDDEGNASRGLTGEDVLLVPAIGGDVGRIVEKLPGVVASDNSAAWSVRGSLAGDTSLVVDGLELYDPYHLREFQSPFTLIDPRVVDRIDVLPGGFTVERGDRHGGFVEIETTNRATRVTGEVELGTLHSRAVVRAPLADGRGAWLVSARGWYPEAVVDSLGLGGGERLRPRLGDLFAKMTRVTGGGTVWSVHALGGYDRISFQESGEDDNERVEAISKNANVWARAARLHSPRLRGETVVSAGTIRRDRDGLASPEEDEFEVRDRRELTYFGLSHDLVWAPGDGRRVKAGAVVRRLDARYRYDLRFTGAPDPLRNAALDPGGWHFGAYVAHRRRLAPGLALEVGLRWDRQDVTDDDHLAPRAHLLWSPSARTETRLALGRYVQSQRIHELAIADGETTYAPAEISDQVEWMIRHRLRAGVSLRLDLYHRDLDRLRTRYENLFSLVELFPEAADDRVAISPDSARLVGAEWTVQGPGDGAWRWWTAYAWARAEDRVDRRDVPRALDQRHTLKALVAWRGRPRWTIALFGTAHTGRPYTAVTAEEIVLPDGSTEIEQTVGPRNAERLPGYFRLDLKIRHRVPTGRGAVSWTVDVLNLTDRDNACCVADFVFQPTGDGEVAVRTDFDTWLGIVPTFRVMWEF